MTKQDIQALRHRADTLFCELTNALRAATDAGDSEATRSTLVTAKRCAYEATVACSRLRAGKTSERAVASGRLL